MKLSFVENSWEDYLFWQKTDKKVLKRINSLIKDVLRHPTEGIGKPEALRNKFSGFWSRRINEEHRMVYKYSDSEIRIYQLRFHYKK